MEKKELSQEMRVLIAFALSFLILLISQRYLLKPPPPRPAGKPASSPAAAPAPPPAIAPTESALPTGPKQGGAEEQITVDAGLYQAVFSTRGAVVKGWTLRNYRDEQNNPLDLVNPDAAALFGAPFSIWVSDEALRREINSALFVPSATGSIRAPATVTFEYSNGRIVARKQFTFTPDSYVLNVTTELSSEGKSVGHALAWRGGFGDIHDVAATGGLVQVFYREAQKIVYLAPKSAEGEESTISGLFAFAGIEDRFFCAAFLPQQGPLRVTAFHHEIELPGQSKKQPTLGVAVASGDSPVNRLRLFVGPKDADVLAKAEPRLPELVDYGWFTFIAKPLFLAMRWMHARVVGNYGWSIVLLTVVINFALFPLKIKSLRSAMKMQKLQPQIKAVQEKYKHLKMKDPRKQEMTKETMDLYKKHEVNPVGGCLPMLLQIPFLYGFYKVLIVSIEMRHAPWILWVRDLSAPEHIFIKVLPLLLCGTQFVLQKMSPATSPDPTQQKMMMFMPVMFLFFFWNMSSGLVLYWLTGNVVGIAQQWYINRTELQHLMEEKKSAAARKKQSPNKR